MRGRARTKGMREGTPENVRVKAVDMIGEGYAKPVAFAAVYNMRRKGKLGPRGGYERVTDRPRGPRGKQRA